jgi:thiamine kinase-like enzyme
LAVDELPGVLARLEPSLGPMSDGPVPLEGGITNRNFRVRFGRHECVVRLPGKDTDVLGISREAEREANQAAAKLGIAPRVLAANEECLVTEFVAGEPLSASQVRAAPEPVARALRAFHDAEVRLPARFWVPDLLAAYAEAVRQRGGSLPPAYDPARRVAERIAQVLPLIEAVACHDDLLPANVLRLASGQAIVLVDWEYAGMGHRLFDLGNLAVNADFGEKEEERLLSAYFGREPSEGQRASLRLMRIMSDAREAAWGVVQAMVSELDFDFEGYASRHFERLTAATDDPRLEEWLDAAAA